MNEQITEMTKQAFRDKDYTMRKKVFDISCNKDCRPVPGMFKVRLL